MASHLLSITQTYDGTGDVYDFIKNFKLAATILGWEADKQATNIPAYLKGNAERIYNALEDADKRDIKKVIEGLTKGCGKSSGQLLQEFNNRMMLDGESPKMFALSLQDMLFKALPTLPDAEKEVMLTNKLFNCLPKNISIMLKMSPNKSWKDIVKAFDETFNEAYLEADIKPEPAEINKMKAFSNKSLNRVSTNQDNSKNNRRFDGECFRCHKYGHKSSDCWSKQYNNNRQSNSNRRNNNNSYNNHNRNNNTSNNCNANTIICEDDAFLKTISSDNLCKNSNLMHLDVIFTLKGENDSFTLRALIDTGANRSFINIKDVPQIIKQKMMADFGKYGAEKKILKIGTADHLEPANVVISNFDIKIDDFETSQSFIITDRLKSEQAVLGRDFLSAYDVEVHNGSNKIVIHSKKSKNFSNIDEKKNNIKHNISCKTIATVVIEPNTEKLLELTTGEHIESDTSFIFENTNSIDSSLLWASSLHKLNGSQIRVSVINNSDKHITIQKDTEIGFLEEVESVTTIFDGTFKPTDHVDSTASINKIDARKFTAEQLANIDKLDLGRGLTRKQRNKLKELLLEFYDIFSWNEYDIGKCKDFKMKIDTGDHPPIKTLPYRTPPVMKEEINNQVENMLKNGIIEESDSPWCFPIVIVKKKNGKWRFCIDFTKLNKITRKDSYPLPRIDDSIEALGNSVFFTTLDCASGYWQIEIDEKDREKTAFIANNKLYQFICMPFGLTNAPAEFQRAMNKVLQGLAWLICMVYLDDIIVYAQTFDEHINRLRLVFNRFREANLKIQPTKCSFAKDEVKYLGYLISKDGLKPVPEKTKAIVEMSPPKKAKDLKRFLGALSYYRRFIENFSDIASPLYHLTQSNSKFKWSIEANNAFESLKEKLISSPILMYPNFSLPFEIECDASNNSIGAVLVQSIDNMKRVICYASRHLTATERRYSTTERELLAIVWSIKYFQCYIFGRKVRIHTDHKPLADMSSVKDKTSRLNRLHQKLQEQDHEIIYIPGEENTTADLLSRLNAITVINSIDWDAEQNKDRILQQIKRLILLRDNDYKNWKNIDIYWFRNKQNLVIESNVLFRQLDNIRQTVVPEHLVQQLIKDCHEPDYCGHLGAHKTFNRIKQNYYWINQEKDVIDFCKSCDICQKFKSKNIHYLAPLQPIQVERPFQLIGVDITGPLPCTPEGNKYIIVAIDYFSKYCVASAIKDFTAKTTAQFIFNEIICKYRCPTSILTDQGTNFEASMFQALCALLKINKLRTTAYHPQCNGLVERLNRTIKSMIACYVNNKHNNWDKLLNQLIYSYNTSIQETIGISPYEVLFSQKPQNINDVILRSNTSNAKTKFEIINEIKENTQLIHKKVEEKLSKAYIKEKKNYDKRIKTIIIYEIGDLVQLINTRSSIGHARKFEPKFIGPYKVIEQINNVNYKIEHCKTKDVIVVHYNRLFKYNERSSLPNDLGEVNNNKHYNRAISDVRGSSQESINLFELALITELQNQVVPKTVQTTALRHSGILIPDNDIYDGIFELFTNPERSIAKQLLEKMITEIERQAGVPNDNQVIEDNDVIEDYDVSEDNAFDFINVFDPVPNIDLEPFDDLSVQDNPQVMVDEQSSDSDSSISESEPLLNNQDKYRTRYGRTVKPANNWKQENLQKAFNKKK